VVGLAEVLVLVRGSAAWARDLVGLAAVGLAAVGLTAVRLLGLVDGLLGRGGRSASTSGIGARRGRAGNRACLRRLFRNRSRRRGSRAAVRREGRRGHRRDLGRGRGSDLMRACLLRGWEKNDRSDPYEGERGRDGKQADCGDHDPRHEISHFSTPLPLRHPGCRNLNRSGVPPFSHRSVLALQDPLEHERVGRRLRDPSLRGAGSARAAVVVHHHVELARVLGETPQGIDPFA
jgi:hypothetical protein